MGRIIIGEQATPATPGAGFVTLFPKSDHVLYMIDENGVETVVATLPVTDTVTLIKGSVDSTKQIRFEVDGLTTATTRVLTIQDKNITIAGAGANTDITSLGAHDLTGTLSLSEQAILVDAALASDHTWTGPTQSVTAGEELTIGEVAYLKSDGKYWLADADAEATADTKLVMATATIAASATGIVLLPSALSFFRDDSTTEWTVTAAGDVMFLSTTAGELTNNVSGYTTLDIVRVCGYMETATILNFNVGSAYIEVA